MQRSFPSHIPLLKKKKQLLVACTDQLININRTLAEVIFFFRSQSHTVTVWYSLSSTDARYSPWLLWWKQTENTALLLTSRETIILRRAEELPSEVVRALASQPCGLGSYPDLGPRFFLQFSSLHKNQSFNSNSIPINEHLLTSSSDFFRVSCVNYVIQKPTSANQGYNLTQVTISC